MDKKVEANETNRGVDDNNNNSKGFSAHFVIC